MKVQIRDNKNKLELYSDANTVTLMAFLMSFVAMLIGVVAFYVGSLRTEYFPLGFGVLFFLAGSALLINSIKEHKRMKISNGFVYLSASKNNLLLAPNMGMKPVSYKWSKISKIILAKLYIDRDSDGVSKTKNTAIIYFQGFEGNTSIGIIERNKLGISRTPKKEDIIIIRLPKGELFLIQQKLKSFSPKQFKIEIFSKVEFDYKTENETFQP